MRTKTIKLPNGFRTSTNELITNLEIRKLGGEEEDLLVDKEELKKGAVLGQILKNCTVAMGNITDPKVISKCFDGPFLMADITYMLLELRAWGRGNIYVFEQTCPHCEDVAKHRIDLTTLRVDPQKEEFRGKDRVLGKLPDAPKPWDAKGNLLPHAEWSYGDIAFSFRPLYFSDQKMLEAIRTEFPKQKSTREMSLQIVDYDGREMDINALRKFDSDTRGEIRRQLDAAVGGVDNELTMTCRKCTRSFKDNMSMDVRSFFFRTADLPEMRTATPYQSGGLTLISWQQGLDGSQVKSETSPSTNESSM